MTDGGMELNDAFQDMNMKGTKMTKPKGVKSSHRSSSSKQGLNGPVQQELIEDGDQVYTLTWCKVKSVGNRIGRVVVCIARL